mmetsp:Transcript_55681/g.82847  ORF Transcript_55681/g.82847 Transcript_55681/m.82847 type:complete len:82 (-) Transcript_55681:1115-1360(-)
MTRYTEHLRNMRGQCSCRNIKLTLILHLSQSRYIKSGFPLNISNTAPRRRPAPFSAATNDKICGKHVKLTVPWRKIDVGCA